jgi:hypothetical protein
LVVTTVKAVSAGQATPAVVLMNEVLRAMLMTKLKVYVAAAVVAITLGVGGLAFQASGQVPLRSEGRPLTELEVLRREVDILKLQMEVMQAELRALKGRTPDMAPSGAGGPMRPASSMMPGGGSMPPAGQSRSAVNPEPDVEAALRALKERPDDSEVRRRAVEAMERTLQRLNRETPDNLRKH